MGAQERLKVLLAHPGNKRCADCGERSPRFASTTFGVFLCNRCFGIHRGLGTHISKTRSVRCVGVCLSVPLFFCARARAFLH